MGKLCVTLQMLDLCGLPTLHGTGARPRPETSAAAARGAAAGHPTPAEAERALVRIERNFTELTRTVLMIDIEDMPPSMQNYMVGLPRSWVRLFRHLGRAVHDYNRAHQP
jgi:hypothetical protein